MLAGVDGFGDAAADFREGKRDESFKERCLGIARRHVNGTPSADNPKHQNRTSQWSRHLRTKAYARIGGRIAGAHGRMLGLLWGEDVLIMWAPRLAWIKTADQIHDDGGGSDGHRCSGGW